MYYLIDGYNLFFAAAAKKLPLETKRAEFLALLGEIMASINMSGSVIFDSHKDHAQLYPSKGLLSTLEVIFSPLSMTADDYIIEYIRTRKNPYDIILVTSDRELAFHAKNLLVRSLSISEFLDLLFSRTQKATRPKEKPSLECTHQMERLLRIFENRLPEE